MIDILAWTDVETTGLNPKDHFLLEIALVVTDAHLNVLGEFQSVVQHTPEVRNFADDYVKRMHDKTGLWDRLVSGEPLWQIDDELTNYISQFAEPKEARMAGNSVRLDMNFTEKYLPNFYNHLHYRTLDVSTLKFEAAQQWIPEYEKKQTHAAYDDIRESIAELKYLRERLYK